MIDFVDKSSVKRDDSIKYNLKSIIGHPKNWKKEQSAYNALVKKRVDGTDEKHWIKFNMKYQKKYDEELVMQFPSQIVFFEIQE